MHYIYHVVMMKVISDVTLPPAFSSEIPLDWMPFSPKKTTAEMLFYQSPLTPS